MYSYKRSFKSYLTSKPVVVLLLACIMFFCAGFVAYSSNNKEEIVANVKLCDNEDTSKYVKEILLKNELNYNTTELPKEKLSRGNLEIVPSKVIFVEVDKNKLAIRTFAKNIRDALKEKEIILGKEDKILGAKLDDNVAEGMNLKIIRVIKKNEVIKENIKYNVIKRENNELDYGITKVVQEGITGEREKIYKIQIEDGDQVSKTLLSNKITKESKDEIIETGMKGYHLNEDGVAIIFKKVIEVSATAYTNSLSDTGKSFGHPEFGITRTGNRTKRGTIAVDPNLIPLGTRLYVECKNGNKDYGFGIADDTGGAIKGKIIDLFMDTKSEVDRWGRRPVRVYILREQ